VIVTSAIVMESVMRIYRRGEMGCERIEGEGYEDEE
jgi:hypothetical protein